MGNNGALAEDAASRAGSEEADEPTFEEFALQWFERQTLAKSLRDPPCVHGKRSFRDGRHMVHERHGRRRARQSQCGSNLVLPSRAAPISRWRRFRARV